MPRRSKGPRLYFRAARRNAAGAVTHLATWVIRDNGRDTNTGLGADATETKKSKALTEYLDKLHIDAVTSGKRDPSQILIDDVLALYARDVAIKHSRPEETAARIEALRAFWGGKLLSAVIGATCRQYAKERPTEASARRDLEDFRAAINHHMREGLHDKIVSVVLPEKSLPRERWLTREEAATLIRLAWRYREVQKGYETDKRPRKHVARFMVVASYMGSRAAVICGASIEKKRPAGKPWIDLDTGVFYGRPAGQKQTKKRRQLVRVPPPLLGHLRRWRANGQRYVVEWRGEPVSRVKTAHNAAVKAAGLGTDVTPHTWRHTAVTWAMQRAGDLWEVADFFGMTVQVLEQVYGHHHPKQSAGVHATFKRHRNATANSEQKPIAANDTAAKTTANSTKRA